MVTMIYIRPSNVIHLTTGSLHLSQHLPISHSLAPGNHFSTLFLYGFDVFF